MMAGRGLKHAAYRLFTPGAEGPTGVTAATDEFDESDVWCCGPEPMPAEFRKPIPASRAGRRRTEKGDHRDRAPTAAAAAAVASLPMNIPDWSKILREEYRGSSIGYSSSNGLFEEEEEGDGLGTVVPPHELLWRNRAASFSVHEGIGRTLKGRDLSRVRNAIWEKTGFQD